MKLKIFGKIKMKKTDLNLKRLEILRNVKKNIIINGWNDNIFSTITKRSKYNEEEVRVLFSKGYRSTITRSIVGIFCFFNSFLCFALFLLLRIPA